ncbi:heavy metal translocating P-type ATPase [Halococcus sp. AFM35]|uniref:heavy metal translocating P-type ATPase n=1 Tax=Halococcus sp. AFM35 TaxID=3421653 RepID=UPI003EC1386A
MSDPQRSVPDGGHDHDHDHSYPGESDHVHEDTTHVETQTVQLDVPEMDCPSCAQKVTNSVDRLDGIDSIDTRPTSGVLTVHYDSEHTTSDAVRDRVEAAGYTVKMPDAEHSESLSIPEMDCPSCANKVGNALDDVDGLVEYDLQPTTGTADVTYDSETTDSSAVVGAIEGAGYDVANTEADGTDEDATDDRSSIWTSTRGIKTWISGAFLGFGVLFEYFLTGQNVSLLGIPGGELALADLLLLVGIAVGGQVIVRNGYYSAKNLSLDIDFLMTAAILGATGLSLFFTGASLYIEAASLAFLFNVAELLERYSVNRARNSLEELMELSPDTAVVRRDGDEQEVAVEDIDIGEVVLVEPGEKIPMDGEVTEGESAVNQAPITGESVPVDKQPGEEVYAGTINEQGYLEIEVTSDASDNTLSRVIEMVENAQSNKTDREQFVERFSGYYTPTVVGFAILTALLPPLLLGGAWVTWFVRGITLLVLACPCAFVISTPVSVVSGITSAAKNGVLIKGGNHLETMGEVDAVAFDKTGTLTKGELTVTDVVPLNENTDEDVLRCARGLEKRSEHPIGDAIIERADERGLEAKTIDDFESITGKGVRANLNGQTHYAGKPSLFEDLGFDLDHVHLTTDGGVALEETKNRCADREDCLDLLAKTIPRLQGEGKTVVLVGTEDELEGVIAIADEVRPDAKLAVEGLHEAGIEKLVMLTGDNEGTAKAIAEEVGVDEFRAELLPDEKVEAVDELLEEHETVAMVGDGINDAPAMATASVGVAMGAAGTDTALETADIALMADDLSKLPYLYDLSNRANGVIRQNIWGSLGAKALLAIGVPFGLVSVVLAVLVGDVGMTLLVTGNAMRLSRVTPENE